MILEEQKVDFETNGQFQKKAFNFHVNAKAYKMLFSNIYTDKVKAIVREYSTNAYDAHVQAGIKDRPFKVHLPTKYEPVFKVRDYGFGLTKDEVENVFASFFYSTKNNSNDFVGCLGLGSCSAFSLVQQFLVNSYQNGKVSSYSCHIGADGCPSISFLTEQNTDQENGLEVIVNIDGRAYEFQEAAKSVYKWFNVKPTLNSQEVQQSFKSVEYKFSTDWYGFTGQYGNAFAIMGNVAYPIPSNFIDGNGYIKFEIGELEFDPGREKLSLDDKTTKNLKEKIGKVKEDIGQEVAKQIRAYKTPLQRATAYSELNNGFLYQFITDFSKEFSLPRSKYDIAYVSGSTTCTAFADYLPIGKGKKYYLRDVSFSFQRMKQYAKSNGYTLVLLTQEQIDLFGITPEELSDLSQIPKIERSKTASKPVKVKAFHAGYYSLSEATLDPNQEFVYVNMERGKTDISVSLIQEIMSLLKKNGIIFKLYALSKNNPKKIFKNGTYLVDFLKKNVKLPPKAILKHNKKFDLLQYFDKRFKVSPIDYNSLYTYLEVAHDDTLDKLAESYYKEYPLLTILTDKISYYHHFSKEEISILKEYIHELH